MKALVVGISALFLSTAAFGQNGGVMSGSGSALSSGAADTAEAPPADEGQGDTRRICRRVETASGSRIPYRRVCMTAAEWRNADRRR